METCAPVALSCGMTCPCPGTPHALLQDLGHTAVVDAGGFPALRREAYPGYFSTHGWELRRCEACGAWWWTQVTDTDHPTYDRGDEQTVRSVVHDRSGVGLRCADEAAARALVDWYPELVRAAVDFDRVTRREEEPDVALARAAHAALAPLVARHPGAGKLGCVIEVAAILPHWRGADVLFERLRGRMQALVEHLKKQPADAAAIAELSGLQARCAAARDAEAVPDHHRVDLLELWTVALAPAHAAWWERQQLRFHAQRPEPAVRTRILALDRAIDASWRTFLRAVRCPTPVIELRLLHRHLSDLAPSVYPFDDANWHAAEEVAMRVKTLMARHGLGWEPDQLLHEEVEKRLGLPPTCERDRSKGRFPIRRVPPRGR